MAPHPAPIGNQEAWSEPVAQIVQRASESGDSGPLMAFLSIKTSSRDGQRLSTWNVHRGPIMLMLIDAPTLARADSMASIRQRAKALMPEITLLIICPHPIPRCSIPAIDALVVSNTAELARTTGIMTLPGAALLASDGHILWASDSACRLSESTAETNRQERRMSGALALGDVFS